MKINGIKIRPDYNLTYLITTYDKKFNGRIPMGKRKKIRYRRIK